MLDLDRKLLQFDHPRATPWAPPQLRARLTRADVESESSFQRLHGKPPVTLRWRASWPGLARARKAKAALRSPLDPGAAEQELEVTLGRRQVLELAAQLRGLSGCYTRHLVVAGERRCWLLQLPAHRLPAEELWQDERFQIPELVGLLQQGDAETRGAATWILTRAASRAGSRSPEFLPQASQ